MIDRRLQPHVHTCTHGRKDDRRLFVDSNGAFVCVLTGGLLSAKGGRGMRIFGWQFQGSKGGMRIFGWQFKGARKAYEDIWVAV